MGLVFWVMPSVNVVRLPITLPEKFSTPFTTEAAKSAPGKFGRLMLPPPEEGVPVERVGTLVGKEGS